MRALSMLVVLSSGATVLAGCGGRARPATLDGPQAARVDAPMPDAGIADAGARYDAFVQDLACPAVEPKQRGLAPWDVWRPLDCIRGPEGRWSVARDASDRDGWTYLLTFDGADGRQWQLKIIRPVGLARRRDGHVVVLDLKEGATLISPEGKVVWSSSFAHCGAVANVAVGWDDVILFTCGYSLLRIEADGRFGWQKWPFGDTHLGGPWVDAAGTIYVSGGGTLAALAPDGTEQWKLATGFNRHIGAIGWLPGGDMVFTTTMAARHSPTSRTGVRRYYRTEPPELFVVTRKGKVVRQETIKPDTSNWPTVLPEPEDRTYRAPSP